MHGRADWGRERNVAGPWQGSDRGRKQGTSLGLSAASFEPFWRVVLERARFRPYTEWTEGFTMSGAVPEA